MGYALPMRGPKAGPPRPPRGDTKVISIVEELERRQMARVRDRASAMHLRELESSLELIDHTAALKELDFAAELAKVESLPPEEARRERAQVRAARALQSCLLGDPEAGLAEWAEVIAEVPELAHPYLVRARWLMQTDPPAAIADYDRAAQAEPKNPTVYCRRGDCYAALGDQDRALANYRRALALDPSLFDVHHSMAKILGARGEHAAAAVAYGHAIALAPRYADFYLGRAQALERLGDYEGALRDHARILELDPSRNDVRFYRIICLHRAGHVERAIEGMLRLIEVEPDDHHNYRILGKMRIEAGQQRLALADLTRSLELSSEALTYAHRGRAHWELGERELALADFEEAVAKKPGEPEFYLGQAKALASLDRVEEALASTSRALELSPDHAFAYVMRAVYRAHVDGEEAFDAVRADLDRAVELEPENASFRRQRAEYLIEFHHCAAALVDIEKVIARAAGHPDTRPGAASLYYSRGYCKSRLDEEISDLDEDHWEEEEDTRARCLSAIADLEKAIELGLRTEDVYSELWNAWCQVRDDAMVAEALDRGCAAVPESAMLFYFRHGRRRAKGDLEGAAADKAKAIENGWQWRDD
jgi:tetratricopeptide (TPR) repeat protein